MAGAAEEENERVCRICRCEDFPDQPLSQPCRCSGSVGLLHQTCLELWLAQSARTHCELCSYQYKWRLVYPPGTPSTLPALGSGRASLQQPLPRLQQPRGTVRWGSRKAGSTGFKTKSAVKKRFRITGGGALRRMSSGKRHLNLHKSSTRIHRLGAWLALAAPAPAPSRQPALP